MTEDVKKLIDQLPIISNAMVDWKDIELVSKSDVIKLVEKLTKWNPAKSAIHPKEGADIILKNDNINPPIYDAGYWDGKEYMTAITATHWRYIY